MLRECGAMRCGAVRCGALRACGMGMDKAQWGWFCDEARELPGYLRWRRVMADAGIWIIWDHCVLLGGGARERGTWTFGGSPEGNGKGGGSIGEERASWATRASRWLGGPMTGRPRLLRAAAMPGLLALDGRLAPTSLGRSATDLLEY